jgi:two-component system sensor histidine kinase KdpD
VNGAFVEQNAKLSIVRREARGILFALVLIAVTTAVLFFLRHYFGILRGAVLYLLPVMFAGYQLGLIPALVTAVAGVILSGYLYFAPLYSFQVASPQEALNLILFIFVAVVVSHLASQAKRNILIARKREREVTDLYAFSRRLAAAPSAAEIFVAIQDHLANLVQRKVVLLGAAEAREGDGVPESVRAAVRLAERDEGRESTVDDGNGNIWLIRRVSPKTTDFGLVAVDLGNVSGEPLAEMRQRIDDALADAAATLERLDVARALNDAKMRSETELLREALIGSVSHELRTPLASILGAATILHNAPALAGDPRLLELTAVVRDEAERLNIDIQNLLDATTISRHQVRPKLQWVEPVDIVNSAFEHRRRRLAGYPVSFDLDSNLPIVHVDPAQVEQALVQIIDNAAKYSPAGAPIRVAAHPNGQTVMLTVHDNGAGLTVEEKKQVGGRFFRGPRHAATTSGSGLGLWIANAFVTANGGRVEVESDGADRGTTVTIHLPMSPEAERLETNVDE